MRRDLSPRRHEYDSSMRGKANSLRQNARPNARRHDPDPAYMRALLEISGLSARAAANQLGLCPRTLQRYVSPQAINRGWLAPYPVQYALERLAARAQLLARRRDSYDDTMSKLWSGPKAASRRIEARHPVAQPLNGSALLNGSQRTRRAPKRRGNSSA